MPNYTYSGYASQATPALRLAMARQFLGELNDKVLNGVGKDGAYRNAFDIVQLIKEVKKDIEAYETKVATRTGGGMSRIVRGTAS